MNINTESVQSKIAFNTCWHRGGMRERKREGFTAFDLCRTYLSLSGREKGEDQNEWSVQGKSVGEFHTSCRFQLFSQDSNGHYTAAQGECFVYLIHTISFTEVKLQTDF